MKIKYILAVSMLAFLGFASCEMKDEILDKNKIIGDTGFLEMGVAVQSNVTKSDVAEPEVPAVSAEDFPVEIVQTEGGEYKKTYSTYADLQKENPIELPVGKYTVRAHTPGEIQPVMDEPYYGGQLDQLNITKDITSEANVVCKMENTKIQIIYDPEFNSTFKTWKITITDGSSHVLTFDETDLNPKPKYWLIEDNVSTIEVSIVAKPVAGGEVKESRYIIKPEGEDSEFWAGSDALNITMKPGKPTGDPTGVGIDIKVDVTFDGSEETVEIPVEGGDDKPVLPPSDGPTITIPQAVYTLPDDMSLAGDANAVIKASAKLKSVQVQITAGNEQFGSIVEQMELGSFDLMTVEDPLKGILTGMGIVLPTTENEEYSFPIGKFFTMISPMGVTVGEGHVFTIVVEDTNGKTATDKVSVKVTE